MKVGDLLTFKSRTRFHYRKATRVIRGFSVMGYPEVAYSGWRDFIVRPSEIISFQPVEK